MSPLKSKRQMRWMFANKPKMAKEFTAATPSISKLPETKGFETIDTFLKGKKKKV